jgi:hypothetical protein
VVEKASHILEERGRAGNGSVQKKYQHEEAAQALPLQVPNALLEENTQRKGK